jgi:hypothetical protein
MIYSKFFERLYSGRIKIAKMTGEFFSFRPNYFYLGATVLIQAASWWLASFIYRTLTSDLMILHYNVDFGIDWVGDPNMVFYFPLIGLGLWLVSVILLFVFGPGHHFRIDSHYLMGGALLANAGMFTALVLVYMINFK